uniref:NGFI-A-binding protein 2 n=1 Tax=Geotrypetes seraphini TaxID=260995 RepID=A0A6P8Q4R2_GEOSA|nr:NGFI-A-binding protein 2 [Geotrypetes seraphini]
MQKKSSLPGETAAGRTEEARRAAKPRSSTDLATMSLPRTLGELQLYRVLQRANLLSYYETFIQQGGDDVQQLCEAGEEEFLEIMSLVGMATKPLHVRRLQKALREWATNPALFNQPVASIPVSSIPLFKISETGGRKSISNGHGNPTDNLSKGFRAGGFSPRSPSDHGEKVSPLQMLQDARLWQGRNTPEPDGFLPEDEGTCLFPPAAEIPEKLEVDMVQTISESVDRLMKSFPQSEPAETRSLLKLNKKLAKSVGHIFEMAEQDRRKEEEIRKYSIIYGRFDSKRREGKQLTLHEMTINEAAAQFCMRDNTLLLRRVELFSLSRQVARESMYLTTLKCSRLHPDDTSIPQPKKLKQEVMEQSTAESLQPAGCDPYTPMIRAGIEEDTGSLSGESLDGHLQAVGSSMRLTPSPVAPPEGPLSLSTHGPWSRHILQQTLMDEGLRLARLVSHDRMGRLSPCKPQISEFEDSALDISQSISSHPSAAELQRGSSKGDQETSQQ